MNDITIRHVRPDDLDECFAVETPTPASPKYDILSFDNNKNSHIEFGGGAPA